MVYRHVIDATSYVFSDLRDLLAKATPPRSGDRLAGIAAARGDQDPHRAAIAQHRRGLEDLAFSQRQARQASLQRVADRDRR